MLDSNAVIYLWTMKLGIATTAIEIKVLVHHIGRAQQLATFDAFQTKLVILVASSKCLYTNEYQPLSPS